MESSYSENLFGVGRTFKSLESLSRGENGGHRNTEGCYSLEYLNQGALRLLSVCGGQTLHLYFLLVLLQSVTHLSQCGC